MRNCLRTLVFIACVGLAGTSLAKDSLPPEQGGLTESMGQPKRWMPYAGLGAGAYKPADPDDADPTGTATLGLFHSITSPITALGLAGEGYVGARGDDVDGGVRGLFTLRPIGLALGADYNIRDNDVDFITSFLAPIRRGGLFGHGIKLRVDWVPTRDHTFNVGVVVPFSKWMGRTRPRSDHVSLTVPKQKPIRHRVDSRELERTLEHVRDAALWINRFTTPFFDPNASTREKAMGLFVERVEVVKQHIAERNVLYPHGRSYPQEIRVYHDELDRAFSIAASGRGTNPGESVELGRAISKRARQILLDEVILPYNRTLGRFKKPDTTIGFAGQARDAFLVWLGSTSSVPADRRNLVMAVLEHVLDVIEESRAESAQTWGTSQLVWIPLHLALRPDQLDTQEEFDALLERAIEQRFSEGNEHYYVVNEQFQWEFLAHVRKAQDYHVLWIHDYRGVDSIKEPDRLGFDHVIHGYMHALTEHVRKYDERGKMPVYMIFLDQNFYEPNVGRLWMTCLEDPLGWKPPRVQREEGREMRATVLAAQEELRAAVAGSRLLQERARRYGDDWLKNQIKVHVSITNPVDWSFWSKWIIPVMGVPDVVMRDHRKISFYDVTEADPDKGEAIFTGMGVGEHYAGPTWEDRAILVAGPSLVGLKDAARQLLLNQGFAPDQIPYPLRPVEKPDNYGELVARRVADGQRFRAMQIHNQTGYASKPINVVKAALYSALPSGTMQIVPDSLWNSPFWAGMLVGQALRGGHIYVISPALDNAPSAGFPQMSRAQEIFTELVVIRQMLADEIAATGGSLNVGIYAVDLDVGDVIGRATLIYDYNRAMTDPLLREFFRFDPENEAQREELEARFRKNKARVLNALMEKGFKPDYLAEDVVERKPKLHLKAQLFLNPAALDLLRQVDMPSLVEQFFVQRAHQVHGRDRYVSVRDEWKVNGRLWEEQLSRLRATVPPEELAQVIAYMTVGSQNMDYRGTMMDGEVIYLTSGGGVLVGLLDLTAVVRISTWLEDLETLDELLPPYSEWQRRVGRFMKYLL